MDQDTASVVGSASILVDADELKKRRLINLFIRQAERRTFILKFRAFKKWHDKYPLVMQCIELKRQLQERSMMLEAVRSSYLKDVVSVKTQLSCLSKLAEESITQHVSRRKIEDNLTDLHTVPSANLRQIISKAEETIASDMSSALVRDALIDCGLVDPAKLRAYNPWEKSRSYRRLLRAQRGPSYDYPDTGGNSFELAAPRDYRMFVRYCQDCIGVVQFVKDWNNEVEKNMRFRAEYGKIDSMIDELKRVINSLQNTIIEKETSLIHLRTKCSELEEAKEWFDKWSFLKEEGERKAMIDEKHRRLVDQLHMVEEDREALRRHLISRHQESMSKVTNQLVDLQRQLRKIAEEREQEALARLSLADDLQRMMQARANMKGEIDKLKSLQSQDISEKDMLSNKLAKADQIVAELEKELRKLQREFDHHKSTSSQTINNLQSEIKDLSMLLEKKDNDLDDLRADLRTKKAENAHYAIEIASLQQQLAQTQFRLDRALNAKSAHNGELVEEPELPPTQKPSVVFVKYPLKVVAIAIRALMKFRYFLQTKDPSRLGSLGDRIQLCQAYREQVRLKGEMQKKASTIMAQETDLSMLRRMKGNLEQQLTGANKTIDKQKEDIKDYQGKIDGLNKLVVDISREKDRLSTELQSRSTERANSLAPVLRRAKVFANLQRTLGKQLAKSAFDVRAFVHTLEIEEQLKRLEDDKQQIAQWTQQTQQIASSLYTDVNSNSSSPSSVKRRQTSMIAVKAATSLRRSVLTRKPPSADSSAVSSPTAAAVRPSMAMGSGVVDMQAAIAAAVAAANDPNSTAAVITNDSTLLVSPSKPILEQQKKNWSDLMRQKARQWMRWMHESLPEYVAYFNQLDAVEEDNLRHWLLGDALLPGHLLQQHQKRLWSSSSLTRRSQAGQSMTASGRTSMIMMTPGFVAGGVPDYEQLLAEVSGTVENTMKPFATSLATSVKKKAKLEMLVTCERPQWNVRTMYIQDMKHTEALCRQQAKDLQQLDAYIYRLRQQYNEALQRVQQLEDEKRDLLQRTPMKATRRSNTNEPVVAYGNGNSETRAKLRQMKSSFMHLIDKNDMNAYLNKVIETIDQAKQEVQQEKEDDFIENTEGMEGEDASTNASPTRRMTKARSRSVMRKAMGSFRGSVNAGGGSFSQQPTDGVNLENDKPPTTAAAAMTMMHKGIQPPALIEEENEHDDDDHHGASQTKEDAPVIIPDSDAAISAAVSRVVAAVRRTSSASSTTSLAVATADANKVLSAAIPPSTPVTAPTSTKDIQQNLPSTSPSVTSINTKTLPKAEASSLPSATTKVASSVIESNDPPQASILVPPPISIASPTVTAKETPVPGKQSPSTNKSAPMSPISARVNKPERSLLQQATSSFSLDTFANSMSTPAPEPLKPSEIIRQAKKQEKPVTATVPRISDSNNIPQPTTKDDKEEEYENEEDEYDDEEEEDIHLFDDELDDDIEDELEIAKQEALAMLKRDNLLRVELDALKVDREQLQQTYDAFKRDAFTEKRKLNEEIDELAHQLATLGAAYEFQQEENQKLREIVQDSYRHYDTEIATKLAELEAKKHAFYAKQRRITEKRDVSTQIACSVCTIQEYGLYDAPSELAVVHSASAHAFPLSFTRSKPHQHGAHRKHASADTAGLFEEDTVPEVQETLTNALQGSALVLAPKAKAQRAPNGSHDTDNHKNNSMDEESSDPAAEAVLVFRHNPKSSFHILYGDDNDSLATEDKNDVGKVPLNRKSSSKKGTSTKDATTSPQSKKTAFASSSSNLPIDTGFTERILSVLNRNGILHPHLAATAQSSHRYPHASDHEDDEDDAYLLDPDDPPNNVRFRVPMTALDKSSNWTSSDRLLQQEAHLHSGNHRMDIFADNSSINIHSNSSANGPSGRSVPASITNNYFSSSTTTLQEPEADREQTLPTDQHQQQKQQQRFSVSFPRTSGELPTSGNDHIVQYDDEVDIEDNASVPNDHLLAASQLQQRILDKNRHMLHYAKQLLRTSGKSGSNPLNTTSTRPSSAKRSDADASETQHKSQQRPLSAAAAVRQKLDHFSSQKLLKGSASTHSRPHTAAISSSSPLDRTIRSQSNHVHHLDMFQVANHVSNDTPDAAELLASAMPGQPLRPVSPLQQNGTANHMQNTNATTKFSKLKQMPRAQSTTALPAAAAAASRNGTVLLSHSASTKAMGNSTIANSNNNSNIKKSVNEAAQEAQFRARTDANSAAFLQAHHWVPRVNDNILGN